MRIGLAQISSPPGDLAGNRDRIISVYHKLIADGAELVVFPELALCGPPPWTARTGARFATEVESALLEVAAATGSVPMLVGALDQNTDAKGPAFFNAAAFCQDGAVQGFARKVKVAPGEAFEGEHRTTVLRINQIRVGVAIGADLEAVDLVAELERQRVDLVISVSAAPLPDQQSLTPTLTAQRLGRVVVLVNATGGSGVFTPDGRPHESFAAAKELTRVVALAGVESPDKLP